MGRAYEIYLEQQIHKCRTRMIVWMVIAFMSMLANIVLVSVAHSQTLVWRNTHAKIYRPSMGWWATTNQFDQQGCYTIRVNLLLDRSYCMEVKRRGAFLIKAKNKHTGDIISIYDRGIMFKEGSTEGWKDNIYFEKKIRISWKDDNAMRVRAKQRFPQITKPIPVRVLMYLPIGKIIGGRDSWDILSVAPLAKATEVTRCAP